MTSIQLRLQNGFVDDGDDPDIKDMVLIGKADMPIDIYGVWSATGNGVLAFLCHF